MRWNNEKMEKEKENFRNQILNPTGKYTDFVIRTYYYIYRLCKENNADWCDGKLAGDNKIMYYIYENYYGGRPDHMGADIVAEIKKTLLGMGYISFKKADDNWRIYILKPLDFLNEDLEDYIKRKTKTLNEEIKEEALEYFDYLNKEGINIYKYKKKCWKCENLTDVYTYLLNIQLNGALNHRVKLYDKSLNKNFKPDTTNFINNIMNTDENLFEEIGLGSIKKIDEYLAQKIPSIQSRHSKKMGMSYFMNICKICGSIQGINFVVYRPEELLELDFEDLKKLVAFKVFPKEINFTIEDIRKML